MSERDVWSDKAGFEGVDPVEYIRTRVLMLAAVFNRKSSDELVAVFQEVLQGYPNHALKRGFSLAESTLERFPTPKAMRELCNEGMSSNVWKYDFRKAVDGNGTPCLIDPVTREFMYRPQDCPEGRAFLAALKSYQKRQVIREPGED